MVNGGADDRARRSLPSYSWHNKYEHQTVGNPLRTGRSEKQNERLHFCTNRQQVSPTRTEPVGVSLPWASPFTS